jgi:effector-binding domain-containing protein
VKTIPILVSIVCLCGCATHPGSSSSNSSPASTRPVPQPDYSITDMRIQELPPVPYFYLSTRTTMRDIGPAVERLMDKLQSVAEQGRVSFAGPAIFVYRGGTEETDKPFDLEVGYAIRPAIRPFGDFRVRTLERFHCATTIYNGPVESIGKAYDKLIGQMIDAHLSPGEVSREFYLLWDGARSSNDIVQVQVGIR